MKLYFYHVLIYVEELVLHPYFLLFYKGVKRSRIMLNVFIVSFQCNTESVRKTKKEDSLKTTAKFYPRNIYRCLKYAAEINSVIQIQTSLSAKAIKLTPPVYISSHLIEPSAVSKDGRTVIRAQVAVRTCQAYTPTLKT